jgi:predicted enzyme related to lactoylglutathione lyase
MVSCNTGITFPPVSEEATGNHSMGQFVWHDYATSNPFIARQFYTEVFGWQYETLGSGDNAYYVIKNDGKAIGGIFKLASKYGSGSEWIASMSVNDVDAAIEYNTRNGGTTIFDKSTFKGRGETAMVQDPQGAIVAFLYADGGDPVITQARDVTFNSWLWDELWTTDLEGSLDYYKGLAAYDTEEVEFSEVPYFLFKADNKNLSGAIGNPVEGARSAWMPYVKVKDVNETVEKAKAAGAHIMMEPNPKIRKGTVAVILDPTGGQITIQQWITR